MNASSEKNVTYADASLQKHQLVYESSQLTNSSIWALSSAQFDWEGEADLAWTLWQLANAFVAELTDQFFFGLGPALKTQKIPRRPGGSRTQCRVTNCDTGSDAGWATARPGQPEARVIMMTHGSQQQGRWLSHRTRESGQTAAASARARQCQWAVAVRLRVRRSEPDSESGGLRVGRTRLGAGSEPPPPWAGDSESHPSPSLGLPGHSLAG